MIFEEWQFEYFGLHSGTFSLASLIKAYRRCALSDHPDKGGQTGVFQETKTRYDELTRRLEYFTSIEENHRMSPSSMLHNPQHAMLKSRDKSPNLSTL